MSAVTKPILLDETGVRIAQAIESLSGGGGGGAVASVNGKTGTVVLDAEDVGAIAEPATAGTNGQVLTSDGNGGQAWATPTGAVASVNGKTGAVVLDADDVGAVAEPASEGTSGQVLVTNGAGGRSWGSIAAGQVVIDSTLTVEGAAADAKAAGDRLAPLENVARINGTIEGSAGAYKYLRYDDGKTYTYANESYVYTFTIGSITEFIYRFTVSSVGLMGLAFYDNSGNMITGSGIQAGTTSQTITVPNGAVTCKATVLDVDDISVGTTIQDIIEDIADINTALQTTVKTSNTASPTSGYYVDYRDGKVSANASMQYIQLPINSESYLQYNSLVRTPDIRGLAFYNIYGEFISGYRMLSTAQTIAIPKDAAILKATVNSADDIYFILTPSDILNYAQKRETINILSAFDNITCVGDSLTWSQVYLANSATRKAYRPYTEILGERTGATVEELANPGYSASAWWDANSESITSKTNQLAIIYLGTNLGLSDTVDTDCVGDDPTSWGETLTADYCRIINAFLTVGAKVILVKPFTTTGNSSAGTAYYQTFAAIDNIATRFGCGVVEPIYLADSAYHKYPDGDGTNAVHYNDLGYAAFADKLITAIGHMDNTYMLNIVPE